MHGLCLKRAVAVLVGMSQVIQTGMELDAPQVVILFLISEVENFNNMVSLYFFSLVEIDFTYFMFLFQLMSSKTASQARAHSMDV